jgi:malonyl-CoA O-methyltransferase
MTAGTHDKAVAARFSAAARSYAASVDIQVVAADMAARLLAGMPDPDRVLEVGCGTGLLTRRLRERWPAAEIWAVDISPAMISQARRALPDDGRTNWRVADASSFDAGHRFPVVASSSSLHWMSPLPELFSHLAGIMTKGGRLAFTMMLAGSLRELREARAAVAPGKRAPARLPLRDEVLDALRAASFRVDHAQTEEVRIRHADAAALLSALHRQGVTGGRVSSGGTPLNASDLRGLRAHSDRHYRDAAGGVWCAYEILAARARSAR